MTDSIYNTIIILGAGISGLTTGFELSKVFGKRVVVVEKEKYSGGLASTIKVNRFLVDIGSHRIQSTVNRKILNYISDSLEIDLLEQPRRGILYMNGMTLKYPPNLINMMSVIPIKKTLPYILSFMDRFKYPIDTSSYKTIMLRKVGRKIYENFYHDYVYKLWGIAPENVAIEGMNRRKTIFDTKAFLKSITGKNDYFYYPHDGIGSIATKFKQGILKNGGVIYCSAQISSIKVDKLNQISDVSIVDDSKKEISFSNPLVLSTIPIDEMHEYIYPEKNLPKLKWRGLRIVYIHILENLDVTNETFYFPRRETSCGRISFIQKYSPYMNDGTSGTVITFEFPSSIGDEVWTMSEQSICKICINTLKKVNVIKKNPTIEHIHTISVKKAYPVYETYWKKNYFSYLDNLKSIDNLLIYGRRGLFLHCNIDHAIKQGTEVAKTIFEASLHPNRHWNNKMNSFFSCCARD